MELPGDGRTMPLSDTKDYRINKSVPDMGYLLKGPLRLPQTSQAIIVSLGYHSEIGGNTLLLKTLHT